METSKVRALDCGAFRGVHSVWQVKASEALRRQDLVRAEMGAGSQRHSYLLGDVSIPRRYCRGRRRMMSSAMSMRAFIRWSV